MLANILGRILSASVDVSYYGCAHSDTTVRSAEPDILGTFSWLI